MPTSLPRLPVYLPEHTWVLYGVVETERHDGTGSESSVYHRSQPLAREIVKIWSYWYTEASRSGAPFTGWYDDARLALIHYDATGAQEDPLLDLVPLFDPKDNKSSWKRIQAAIDAWHP